MHSPEIMTAMLLGALGVPLAGLFLLFSVGSLFFARTRSFCGRLLLWSIVAGLLSACLMWLLAQASLPPPFAHRTALTVFPFGFAVGGFISFFWLWRKTRANLSLQPTISNDAE